MLFPAGSLPTGPPIETTKALLLLDFQRDFVDPDGKLSVPNVRRFLPHLVSLVREFRSKGEVIWVGTEYTTPRSTLSTTTGSHSIVLKHHLTEQNEDNKFLEHSDDARQPCAASKGQSTSCDESGPTPDPQEFLASLSRASATSCCVSGSPGVAYPDIIQGAIDPERDLVLLKSNYSAFVDTPLLTHLRTRLVTELYVCGSLSNISVYASVLDAVCHGMQVTIVEDCLGYLDEACHVQAVGQMADHMGANGVDCQELRDDLAGLLGEVINEEDFTTSFQVSLPPPARTTKSHVTRNHINDWISTVAADEVAGVAVEAKTTSWKPEEKSVPDACDSLSKSESSSKPVNPASIEHSPPRKRSTSDLDSVEDERVPKLSHKPSNRRTSNNGHRAEQLKQKHIREPSRKQRLSPESANKSRGPMLRAKTAPIHSGQLCGNNGDSPPSTRSPSSGDSKSGAEQRFQRIKAKSKKKSAPSFLRPGDHIGQGDCRLCLDLLDPAEAEAAFYDCKKSIKWQKMFHRTGEVPRLVAVQGTISGDGSQVPIYRHPADESPELQVFNSTVSNLRKYAEEQAGHTLNHVLIQWYRDGEDNISEHSDKTLDIVRGSNIVNLSLGAQRTMTLRTKRSALPDLPPEERDEEAIRPSQRIQLPHNSLFVLGQQTNQHWLHAIRADKRPLSEKLSAEVAFGGQRISFTFRHIGTFINPLEDTIWGQGATSKKLQGAKTLLTGTEGEKEGAAMIRAFGQENHRSRAWDWEEWYGRGFDVVNFETKEAGHANGLAHQP